MDNKEENQSISKGLGAEWAECSGGTWEMGTGRGGSMRGKLTTKAPFPQG